MPCHSIFVGWNTPTSKGWHKCVKLGGKDKNRISFLSQYWRTFLEKFDSKIIKNKTTEQLDQPSHSLMEKLFEEPHFKLLCIKPSAFWARVHHIYGPTVTSLSINIFSLIHHHRWQVMSISLSCKHYANWWFGMVCNFFHSVTSSMW